MIIEHPIITVAWSLVRCRMRVTTEAFADQAWTCCRQSAADPLFGWYWKRLKSVKGEHIYVISYTHPYIYVYIYIHIHIYIYTHTHIHTYIHTYIYIHIYMYMYKHIVYTSCVYINIVFVNISTFVAIKMCSWIASEESMDPRRAKHLLETLTVTKEWVHWDGFSILTIIFYGIIKFCDC